MSWFGFLNCYKPSGITSRDVVNIVQRRLQKTKVGHAGTLDPIAEGVLVLGIGSAARLVTHVQTYPKQYVAAFRLGEHSPSEDTETQSVKPHGLPIPTRSMIEDAATKMIGRIQQTPSAYSAIHVNGKRAYQRARQGENFEMPSREVVIHSIQVNHYEYPNLKLTVECGSGTYIRSIGSDLAKSVGSFGIMTALRRSSIGPFKEEQAVSTEILANDDLSRFLLPATMAVENLPKVIVSTDDIQRIRFGQLIDCKLPPNSNLIEDLNLVTRSSIRAGDEPDHKKQTDLVALNEQGQLIALLRPKNGQWHPYRVFPSGDGETRNDSAVKK